MTELATQKKGFPFLKKLKKGFTKKRIIALCLIVMLLIGGRWGWSVFFGAKAESALNTAQVTKGDISVTISGTATIAPIEQYNVVPLVKGDIWPTTSPRGTR